MRTHLEKLKSRCHGLILPNLRSSENTFLFLSKHSALRRIATTSFPMLRLFDIVRAHKVVSEGKEGKRKEEEGIGHTETR